MKLYLYIFSAHKYGLYWNSKKVAFIFLICKIEWTWMILEFRENVFCSYKVWTFLAICLSSLTVRKQVGIFNLESKEGTQGYAKKEMEIVKNIFCRNYQIIIFT